MVKYLKYCDFNKKEKKALQLKPQNLVTSEIKACKCGDGGNTTSEGMKSQQ